jgi:magnesium-dependent phosphatase 1
MLVVFDLDFTLWDCGGTWCDHTNPPYCKKNGFVLDDNGLVIRLYNDVIDILETLRTQSIPIAIASRTSQPLWANDLLNLFDLDKYFDYKEIYPSSKVKHFNRLNAETKIPYNQMLFFDDEFRNIEEVRNLGVESVFVRNGIDFPLFYNSVERISTK